MGEDLDGIAASRDCNQDKQRAQGPEEDKRPAEGIQGALDPVTAGEDSLGLAARELFKSCLKAVRLSPSAPQECHRIGPSCGLRIRSPSKYPTTAPELRPARRYVARSRPVHERGAIYQLTAEGRRIAATKEDIRSAAGQVVMG